MGLQATVAQVEDRGRRQRWSRGKRNALCFTGLLAIIFTGGLLCSAAPAMASSPVSWSPPTLIDEGTPKLPLLDGGSCPSPTMCVAVDGFGNVLTSTEPTGGPSGWTLARVAPATRLWDVSCSSTELCVGVGANSDVITSTDPAGGAGAWAEHRLEPGAEAAPLFGVSCPSHSLCVAVGGAGEVLTSTEPTGGIDAWTTASIDGASLLSVSCPTDHFCVAVDAEGNVATSTEPTAGPNAWTVINVDANNEILGVSCPSESLCIAVDGSGNILISTDPTGGASAWSVAESVDGTSLGGVSCPSESFCASFDNEGNVLTSSEPTGGVGAWTKVHVDVREFLWSITCASTTLCLLLDGNGDVLTSTEPTAGAGAWATAHVDDATFPALASVSCASISLCLVSDAREAVLASTDPTNHGAWTGSPVGHFFGLSCPSVQLCLGVEEDLTIFSSADPTGGVGAWAYQFGLIFEAPLFTPGIEYLGPSAAVSCPSTTFCAAYFDAQNDATTIATSSDPTGGEAAWSSVKSGQFEGSGNVLPGRGLRDAVLGLSCPSELLCAAVDGAGNVLVSTDPASDESVWEIGPVDTSPLWAISCPAASLCIAGDGSGNILTTTDPSGGTTAWHSSAVDAGHRISAVSCPSAALCVAVDNAGDILVSTDPASGAGSWNVDRLDPEHSLSAVSCIPGPGGLCIAVDNAGYALTGTFALQQTSGNSEERPTHTPSNAFTIAHTTVRCNGRIVLSLKAPDLGTFTAKATGAVVPKANSKMNHKAAKPKRHHEVCGVSRFGARRDGHRNYGGNGGRHRSFFYGKGSSTAHTAGTVQLTIRPRRSALRILRRYGRLRVRIEISFAPDGGTPRTKSKTVSINGTIVHRR